MGGALLAIVLAPLAVAVVLAVTGGVLRLTGAPTARGLDDPASGGWAVWLRRLAGVLSVTGVAVSFVLGLVVLSAYRGGEEVSLAATWFQVGELQVPFSLRVDGLRAVMVMVVTGVSLLVHLFSIGYMHGDRDVVRYFAELSLFSAAMLLLVLADDFFVLYMGWELVGASSYLLISYYFERPAAAAAGKKAFLTTRIGDVGLLLGILAIVSLTGSLEFGEVFGSGAGAALPGAWRVAVPLLLFAGAVGKSAQFPLHVWLPDAMEGPTPVSALLHAATMVAAGVYLVARTFPLFAEAPEALTVVGWIGAFTALLAATIAVTQHDIKKVLAYSTVSQLGFMMTALGVGAPAAAVFHLFTHAWFKALLFLAAGSIIHATGRQLVEELGGLRRYMPVTAVAFAAGALALAGIPPFAGFWSKEGILGAVAHDDPVLLAVLLAATFLTAFYIARLGFLVFLGPLLPERQVGGTVHPAPEPGPTMTVPLALLAVAALGAGFLGARFLGGPLQDFLELEAEGAEAGEPIWLTVAAVGLGVLGIGLAWLAYARRPEGRPSFDARLEAALGGVYRAVGRAYDVDDAYSRFVVGPFVRGARFLARWIDTWLIDGIVNGIAWTSLRIGSAFRLAQSGRVRDYLVTFAAGVIVVAALVIGALR